VDKHTDRQTDAAENIHHANATPVGNHSGMTHLLAFVVVNPHDNEVVHL